VQRGWGGGRPLDPAVSDCTEDERQISVKKEGNEREKRKGIQVKAE